MKLQLQVHHAKTVPVKDKDFRRLSAASLSCAVPRTVIPETRSAIVINFVHDTLPNGVQSADERAGRLTNGAAALDCANGAREPAVDTDGGRKSDLRCRKRYSAVLMSTRPPTLPSELRAETRTYQRGTPSPGSVGEVIERLASKRGGEYNEWRYLSPGGQAAVSVRYMIPSMPRGWRLARWITPWYSEPEGAPHSLFLSKIGRRGKDSGDLSGPSVQLTRDILSDLRDVIAVACGGRRCATALQSLSSEILAVTRASKPIYERLDRDSTEVEPFGHKYEWRVSTEPATVDVAYSGITVNQVACELTMITSTGANLHYDAFHPEIELFNPSGHIEFLELDYGVGRVTISGAALALRGAPDAAKKK